MCEFLEEGILKCPRESVYADQFNVFIRNNVTSSVFNQYFYFCNNPLTIIIWMFIFICCINISIFIFLIILAKYKQKRIYDKATKNFGKKLKLYLHSKEVDIA